MKVCSDCGKAQRREAFGPRPANRDGLNGICRACMTRRKRERRAADPKARTKEQKYESRPDVQAHNRRRRASRRYGISVRDLEMIEEIQGGVCALCDRPTDRTLAVDHDHETGRVRGLLCYHCNSALGQAGDDPELLRRMATYVEDHRYISTLTEKEMAVLVDG